MNNPIMALAQMAMNRISSDPSFQKNPQARAFMDIMQRGDVAQGQQMRQSVRNQCTGTWRSRRYDQRYLRNGVLLRQT